MNVDALVSYQTAIGMVDRKTILLGTSAVLALLFCKNRKQKVIRWLAIALS